MTLVNLHDSGPNLGLTEHEEEDDNIQEILFKTTKPQLTVRCLLNVQGWTA